MRRIGLSLLAALLSLLLCGCGKESAADKTVVILDTAPTPAPTAEAAVSDGDWYGWWKMDHCKGDWAHMYGYYWDCCAVLSEADGVLKLLLWDEDMPRDNCLSEARLSRDGGALRCAGGSFLDRELSPSDWTITEREDACGTLLTIEGE